MSYSVVPQTAVRRMAAFSVSDQTQSSPSDMVSIQNFSVSQIDSSTRWNVPRPNSSYPSRVPAVFNVPKPTSQLKYFPVPRCPD